VRGDAGNGVMWYFEQKERNCKWAVLYVCRVDVAIPKCWYVDSAVVSAESVVQGCGLVGCLLAEPVERNAPSEARERIRYIVVWPLDVCD